MEVIVGSILQSLNKTIIAGIILAIVVFIIMIITNNGFDYDRSFWSAIFRYLHVISGVMWIGLLWYFNFVQIPNMPNIPDEHKPAIGKVIAPAALFWFRWAALATILTGLIVSYLNYYIVEALSFGLLTNGASSKSICIGIGMWLGMIMAYNVWMVIWPNQKKALGIIEVNADEKAKSARTAMLFSRTNTMLSIPMLLSMVTAQNLY
ncbi:MAG: hypothetical protein CFH15_01553 [Alphaproteobacteria bacterium MarineAlpha5_Bin5]|nr:MAG: hypothetical protein CFH15_01553 [Alphaproteobacteria bacterium MarineAlpha5_Bin5]PPR49122.1 MAG: hypothetical protein CFH14_01139 [Alphaproteobacteria bacterium MarineAlpha5_Bin4]|tara:strand:- start:2788 stop:3408 length:621 start_codon:yes stop_codon:yes gene_type:complete